jgi:protein tyrosine phosphatase (PTP) superfamily phosphohydrolase (DUF442 family)
MLRQLIERFQDRRKRLKRSFGNDISTPENRRKARWHYLLFDHGVLRILWTNLHQVAPDIYRSNQPDPRRLKKMHDLGIKSVLNLRGEDGYAHYLFEQESCAALGMTLTNVKFDALKPTKKEPLLDALEAFKTLERPLLLHCKSGSDRAGLASALYLLSQEDASVSTARKQLSLRFLHIKNSEAGIQDHILDMYEARQESGYISIEDWIRTEYDPNDISESFERLRGGK